MRIVYNLKRMHEALGAIWLSRELVSHDQWTVEDIKVYQRRHLNSLIKFARERSPFYRELYAGLNPENYEYTQLPVIDKKVMMENYDRFVTDPRLKLNNLERHCEDMKRDTYYLGQYRVMSTAGSSGFRGVFAFNRNEWRTILAMFQRAGKQMGMGVRLPNRLRMASIVAYEPVHSSSRVPESADFGLVALLRRSAADRLEDLVAALNKFQPEVLSMYPSIGTMLAEEQLEGRLNIKPSVFVVNSEICTHEMKRIMVAAWGNNFFNAYSSTEVLTIGMSCPRDKGIHIFEDFAIVEVVDENNRPVPDGVLGRKILITNLHYFTQPLIRYEITDMVKLASSPCTCGRPFKLIETMEGRINDILELEGINSKKVLVNPSLFYSIEKMHLIRQYQVVHRNDGLHFNLVPRHSNDKEEIVKEVNSVIRDSLASIGVKCPPLSVHFFNQLEREQNSMSKLKLIKKEIA